MEQVNNDFIFHATEIEAAAKLLNSDTKQGSEQRKIQGKA